MKMIKPDWKWFLLAFGCALFLAFLAGVFTGGWQWNWFCAFFGIVFFPIGLELAFTQSVKPMDHIWITVILGYLFYAAVIIGGAISRSRMLWVLLALALLLNVGGCCFCWKQLEAMSH